MNPVVLLDEVDKVGADYRGDPAAALLEVLDPAQNHTFRDHYLELDLDLSDVLFIATANVLETIPPALLDRMELVSIDGYTEDDKVAIARDFLVPRQLERAALTAEEITVTDAALRELASNHTREAGVRSLERLLAKAFRKASLKALPLTIDADDLTDLVGRPRFTPESHERTSVPGVASGLAVTGMGGDVLYIEASAQPGDTAGLTLTGQLGEVMKESAQIALSYVRAHAGELGVPEAALDRPLHVHVPAGAVPKDGPSAGVTMTTALVSLLTGRPVRAEVGMTGEVSLTGRVLPIGGVKQKLLAAQRAGPDRGVPAAAQRARPGRRAGRGAVRGDRAPGLRRARDPGLGAGGGRGGHRGGVRERGFTRSRVKLALPRRCNVAEVPGTSGQSPSAARWQTASTLLPSGSRTKAP